MKAPGTVRLVLALFRGIFNKGIAWNMIKAENPIKRIRMPQADNARERFLSQPDIEILLGGLIEKSKQAHDLTVLALNTGARSGELLGLTWGDINLDARFVVFKNTKSGRTRRIPLNEDAYSVFSPREIGSPSDLVFTTVDGQPLRGITKTFQRVADRLFNQKLPANDRTNRVVFHTLRHTTASHLVMSGVPLATVKEILGHRSLSMVERYAHLSPEAQREAIYTLDFTKINHIESKSNIQK